MPTFEGKAGLAAVYGQAMESSGAKYKVYLDERVCILEPQLFVRLVALFEAHPDIGVAGIAGTKALSASFFYSFPLLDIMTRSYKKAYTQFIYIPCIYFF